MGATAEQIAQVRRMVAEPTEATYSDALLTSMIEAAAINDARGLEPFTLNFCAVPPTPVATVGWIPTYDLNAVAADIWEEKAAAVACNTDFSADGGSYSQSQRNAQYLKMAAKYRSRRALGTISFARVDRAVDNLGNLYETVPLVDRIAQGGMPFNASDPMP